MSSPSLSIPPVPLLRSGIPTSSFAGICPRPRSLRIRSQECLRPIWHHDKAFICTCTELTQGGNQGSRHSQAARASCTTLVTQAPSLLLRDLDQTATHGSQPWEQSSVAPSHQGHQQRTGSLRAELDNTESQAAQTRLAEKKATEKARDVTGIQKDRDKPSELAATAKDT